MPAIPPSVLETFYVKGSLRAEGDGFAFDLKNLIAPATIIAFGGLDVDGQTVDAAQVTIGLSGGNPRPMSEISANASLRFPIGATITFSVAGVPLEPGSHELVTHIVAKEIGPFDIPVSDALA